MWFVYVGIGLILLSIGGVYVRRRFGDALAYVGAHRNHIRVVRWALAWLVLGFPAVLVVSVVVTLVLGRATMPRYDGLLAGWLFAAPFAWATLVTVQAVPWLLAIDVAHTVMRRTRGGEAATRVRAIAVLVVVGGFAVYTPGRVLVERGELRVRAHQVGSGVSPPFRIAFLADIQQDAHTDAARARKVYEVVNAGDPDVVLSGGDWVNTGPDHIAAAAATAKRLRSRLGTFSVRGDHEHFAYVDRERSVSEVERAMRADGVAMLNNDVRWFEHAGKRIGVVFLGYNYIVRADPATIDRLVAAVANADYAIVVTHQLDRALAARLADKVDLVLAGHTHGGQLNPVVGVVHVSLARVETPFVDGRYRLGTRTEAIVTAGVGYSIVPFRYASPGSIERIELHL